MTLPSGYFDDLYAERADPWGLEGGWYEDRKRACVLAALPAPRFRRAFEPGCANGALSALLAPRCDELVCSDPAERAVEAARTRLAAWPGVHVTRGELPADRPDGTFDLVVAGELVYYLGAADRAAFWDTVTDVLEPGGTLLAVHWIRAAPEYPVEGDRVHDELAERPGLERIVAHHEADFRLDVYTRVPPAARSVAERSGLR